MSKSSTASTAKIPASQPPAKSAWTRGPPISTTSSSTPRSQSPASANATQPSTPTHSRKPSALGGPSASSTTIRDGVSVPRSIQPTQKPATGLSFGSIAEPSAPISSSPASVPAVSSDASSVKSFGTIPAAANGISSKSTLSRSASKSSAPATPSSSPSPAPGTKPKVDVKSFFMNGAANTSNAPSPTTSSAPEGSPAQRSAAVPSGQAPPQQQAYYSPRPNGPPPSGMATSSTAGPPRSPQYSRQMNNGTGGRNAPPNSAGLGPGSPRMAGMQVPHPPQQHQMPHAVPHAQPQHPGMPMQWGFYYPQFNMDPSHMYGYQWTPQQSPMHPPPTPHSPAPHAVASPSRPPAVLHSGPPPAGAPSTPTPAPSTPSPYTYPYSQPPPPTPQTPTGRLSSQAPAFVPNKRVSSAIKIRNPENGEAVDLSSVASPVTTSSEANASPAQRSVTLGHQRKPTVVRLESEETRKKRMEEEQQRQEKEEHEKREQDRIAKLKRDVEEKKKRKEEEEQKKRKEEEERKKRDEERKKRDEEERKERERKEREEKKKKEEEEKARLRKEEEEKERLRKEEEEKQRLQKEAEEKQRKFDEEKKKKEEEAVKERERKAQEEAAAKAKAEEERQRKEAEEKTKEVDQATESTGSPAPSLATPAALSRSASPLPTTEPTKSKRPIPGPLDLSATSKPGLPPAPLSALATARVIESLDKIQYPDGILSPKLELNAGASKGKFRYDRDFLLQFMAVCKDKPDSLPPLDAIGLEPADQTGSIGRSRGNSRSMGPPANIPARAGLGIGGVFGSKAGVAGSNFMGQFGAGAGKISSSEERFAASQMARSASLGGPPSSVAFPRPTPMVRTASQGGNAPSQSSSLNPTGRTRSQRGGRRHDSKVGTPADRDRAVSTTGPGGVPFEPVEPLKLSENRWTPMKKAAADGDSPEVVERKVKGLLNKLTMEKFDSISSQIIDWANRSEKEKDGRTLIQVIKLVFEKATDEAAWSEMYARLCRKMMEQISSNVQDEGIRSNDGRPIAGGQLFRKYLLNRCQEDFERGWSMKEAAAKAAETKAADDKAVKEAAEEAGQGAGEEVLYSEEYYAAQKAKRRGLGLVKFIGELFKLQMLTERIMHECIKKLLGNVENPEEEEIESLCKLLITVGRQLDTEKARSHMDVYFQRMRELAKNPNITSRMQYMLLDVLELRDRKWVPRNAQAAPTTLAAVHEQAAKDQAKAQAEKDQSVRSMGRESMSRGGSRRGEQRGGQAQPGPDGWTAVSAPRPAGDLTQFGKISKGPLMFGPGSVFAAKSKDGAKSREASMSRTASTSNMFAMLNSDAAAEPPAPGKSSRPPSRKPSADFTQTGITEPSQRKKLNLLPRSKPVADEGKVEEEGSPSQAPSELPSEDEEEASLTDDQAKAKIDENVKEFWAIKDLDEAEHYFTGLPQTFRGRFVDKLVGSALERKEADATLLGDLLSRANEKGTCKVEAMEEGIALQIEFIADIAIDVPAAYKLMAIILKGSKLPKSKVEELAGKIVVEDEPAVHPRERLLKEYEKLEP